MDADFEGDIATKSVHVAHIDGTFAGYIIFYPQGPDMLLENVAVTTPGQGIGPRLIAVCEDAARAQDIARVILYTNIHMTGPRALYPRLGYVETDRRSENGFDRVYFAKTLADELAD
ncbi:Acetyltransferase (GNAT) family protein [Pseudooctadecabacter jejudonensis]|uniref:Acetyltransferase (GNAT) family protein n=2 Tax=Pseudooctadecabacter jejudonensis TaxID=1391910 RepID=A0A1Y5RMF7_9RHOB|nr:Acetyltransferase (GNAT) family protein [Pseudooctadecabacter jejudonensis]